MKRLFSLAWRNLWRTPRRSGVTVAAMALAVLAMILYTSLMQGYLRDLERDLVDVELGDIQIHADGYLERPSLYTRIDDPETVIASLEESGHAAATRLLSGGLVAAEENSAGALLKGVDLARNASVSDVAERVDRGEWLSADAPLGAVLGRMLARTLGVEVGDELIVLGQAADGSTANELLRVRGVLRGVSEATDRSTVFVPEATFRDLFGIPEGAHQILVKRSSDAPLSAAAADATEAAGSHDPRTWRQLMPFMSTMIDTARGAIFMVSAVIYIAIAILILNAMLMSVFERVRELGVLKAIGLSPGRVMTLIVIEALLQAVTAVVVALLFATPLLWRLVGRGFDVGVLGNVTLAGANMPAVWRGALYPSTIAGPTGVFFVLVMLGVLYPGLKASRISPVEAMRHN